MCTPGLDQIRSCQSIKRMLNTKKKRGAKNRDWKNVDANFQQNAKYRGLVGVDNGLLGSGQTAAREGGEDDQGGLGVEYHINSWDVPN